MTKRSVSESLWVTTGHTYDGQISSDIPIAAQSSATLVVLMGMRFLKEIITEFKKYKPKNYPVAIIQNGTTKAEKVVLDFRDNRTRSANAFDFKSCEYYFWFCSPRSSNPV